MDLERNEAAALSRMFSATVFRQLGQDAASPLFSRLIRLTRLVENEDETYTLGHAFDDAYKLLSSSRQRDDYTYRSALVLKRILRRHNLRTATMLNEVRTGPRKADLVVLNGTATAYEIKSDRDSLTRLNEQIHAYREVFASVVVLTGEKYIDQVASIVPSDVGLIELTPRYTLRDHRHAQDQPERIDPIRVLDMLRLPEVFQVLENLGHTIPNAPNTLIRTELAAIYRTLDPVSLHQQMVHVLRDSRSQAHLDPFITSLPRSLRTGSLAIKPSLDAQHRIQDAVQTPLTKALTWK